MAVLARVLQIFAAGGFMLVAVMAYREWRAWRVTSRPYLAAAIATLALVSLLSLAGMVAHGLAGALLTDLAVGAFLAVGYLLFLFRNEVVPASRGARMALAALCVFAFAVTVLVVTSPLTGAAAQAINGVVVLMAWVACVAEPGYRLWRLSAGRPAVQRARLRALVAAYAGIIFITAVESTAYSVSLTPAAQVGLQAFSLFVIVPILYISCAPPRWLRLLWRQPEEEAYAAAIRDLLLHSPDQESLAARALDWGVRLVGGDGGVLVGPEGLVLASAGVDDGQAEALKRGLRAAIPGGRQRPELLDGGHAAIFVPSRSDHGAGGLAVVAGALSPVFGADEAARLEQYTAATTASLERVSLVESVGRREAEVRRLNDDLERRVAQRTAQLEASNRELEAFSYTVSHDLRAPLRAVDGFARILLDDYRRLLPEDGRRYLRMIGGNAEHMGRLIDALLTFSRLGRAPMRRQLVDSGEVAAHAVGTLKAGLDGRMVDFRVGDLPRLRCDPVLLEQVFVNLLDNALKFTRDRPEALIEVGSRRGDGGADEPVFFVRDNGIGFDMRYAERIFGVFQRLHQADDYEGTGAGLAIVQRIVNRHGGRVWTDAVPGQGATFYFTLGGTTDDE